MACRVALRRVRAVALVIELSCCDAPTVHRLAETLVAVVIEVKLFATEPLKPGQHLHEVLDLEAAILLAREHEHALEGVADAQSHEIGEVTRLGTTKNGENLVNRQLQARQGRRRVPWIGWKETRVGPKVKLGPLAIGEDGQPRESGSHPQPFDTQTIVGKRPLGRGQQPIDRVWARTEEVEIASASVYLAANDESAAARQGKLVGLSETSDNSRHPQLERAEHSCSRSTTRGQPTRPGLPNLSREHENIPLIHEIINPHVVTNVLLGSLTQHLLIDPSTVGAVTQVVDHGTAAPPDVRR
jgi:hypothetical protein